jgi:hypothetical protein
MLETIREYAEERLADSGRLEATRRRHAEYFSELVDRARPEFLGSAAGLWLDRFEQEHGNLRAVLTWAVEGSDAPLARTSLHPVAASDAPPRKLVREARYPRSYPQARRDPPELAGAHRNNRTQSDPTGRLPRFRYAVPAPNHNILWFSEVDTTASCGSHWIERMGRAPMRYHSRAVYLNAEIGQVSPRRSRRYSLSWPAASAIGAIASIVLLVLFFPLACPRRRDRPVAALGRPRRPLGSRLADGVTEAAWFVILSHQQPRRWRWRIRCRGAASDRRQRRGAGRRDHVPRLVGASHPVGLRPGCPHVGGRMQALATGPAFAPTLADYQP